MVDRVVKRLNSELKRLADEPVPNVFIDTENLEDLRTITVGLNGVRGTLYDGQTFKLQFTFDRNYPFTPPEVIFVGDNIPVHPHVYSNGHICLSILGEDWSPAMGVSSICLSILSMLSSCKEKHVENNKEAFLGRQRVRLLRGSSVLPADMVTCPVVVGSSAKIAQM